MTGPLASDAPRHYDVLGICSPLLGQKLSSLDIKQAYRRALLLHHPDKSKNLTPDESERQSKFSIDQITHAYKILIDPVSRAEYDLSLRLQPESSTNGSQIIFHSGLETVDLDDLGFDDSQDIWYRSCRCGEARGFVLHESDLEKDATLGEVVIGCRGCSLWLKVLFEAIEAAEGEGEQDHETNG
ncbi:hypothetical protein L228DRAFT_267088 [Xylona heveae TC161]|uniref:Diphthamide biosynthesis protein 4 n=1 Tax=Xylona heveae (strain CBS 132557 / TC161) TaxID=1328760 RepID=A0A165IEJ5_XYLHT|nr:hypothetical protein L228DRAFT_267088 [Xylona heveae TC161]KZF24782.1 hypothetical protein L228DRAFT_267088 [Xylona heveae TC161]